MTTTGELLCQAVTKAGKPCRSWPIDGTQYCALHGPRKGEIQRLGGLHKSLKHRALKHIPPPLGTLLEVLEDAVYQVQSGKLTPSQGQAMSSMIGTIVKVLELTDHEIRLQALEKDKESGKGDGHKEWPTMDRV